MVKGNTIAFIATSSCCMVIVYKQCVEVFTYCYIKYMFTFTKVSFFNVLCLYLKAPKINPDPKRAHDPQLRTTASQYTELTLTPYQQHTHTDTHQTGTHKGTDSRCNHLRSHVYIASAHQCWHAPAARINHERRAQRRTIDAHGARLRLETVARAAMCIHGNN